MILLVHEYLFYFYFFHEKKKKKRKQWINHTFNITVAPVLSGHLWDNAKLAAKDRWPLIPGFKLMGKKHRVFSFLLYCTDLLIASVMAAYTEMVNAQLGLLKKTVYINF